MPDKELRMPAPNEKQPRGIRRIEDWMMAHILYPEYIEEVFKLQSDVMLKNLEMYRQAGDYVLEDGLLRRGVVIRHLVLPGALDNAKRVMDWVAEHFEPGQVLFSLMSQYTPQPGAEGLLRRRVTGAEYRAALQYMENLGITDGYRQDSSSAKEEYTPPFDLTGV